MSGLVGSSVFFAPELKAATKYILTSAINSKGTDASGMNDEEPPLDEVEFSDDEQEAAVKMAAKQAKRGESCTASTEPAHARAPTGNKCI